VDHPLAMKPSISPLDVAANQLQRASEYISFEHHTKGIYENFDINSAVF